MVIGLVLTGKTFDWLLAVFPLVPSYHTEGYQKAIYHSCNLEYIYYNRRNTQYGSNMSSEVLEFIRVFRDGGCPVCWAAVPDKWSNYQDWQMKSGVHS